MGDKVYFVFDNQNLSFYPGESISGNFVIRQSKPKKCEEITISIHGYGEVKWKNKDHYLSEYDNKYGKNKTYQCEETYYESSLCLLARSDATNLPEGEHKYPFKFDLPAHIPSTFEGDFGKVNYAIKGQASRPSLRSDEKIHAFFPVNYFLDLNSIPDMHLPEEGFDSVKVCCWCCASGPITIKAKIGKRGFVPGENIPYCMEVNNDSNRLIKEISASLIKIIIYKSPKKFMTHEIKISELTGPSVGKKDSYIWDGVYKVPILQSSRLQFCTIIELKYAMRFEARMLKSIPVNMYTDVPLTIGTIPLRNPLRPTAPSVHDTLAINENQSFNMNEHADMPPPSYKDVTHIGKEI